VQEYVSENPRTAIGAGAGAAGGALIGGLVFDSAGAAVAGGLVGGLAGGLFGRALEHWSSAVPITLSANADPGTYQASVEIQTGRASDRGSTTFAIR
jgi:outer membrane lipoprotein SlyB